MLPTVIAAAVATFGKDASRERLLQHRRLALFVRLKFVQSLDEEQIGDLLHDAEGIRQAPRPKVVPDAVDLILDLANNH